MAMSCDRDVDRISGLSDELLHCILLRLPHTAAAARTSLLSRRWRRVWAHLPELRLFYDAASTRTLDRVDAALAACSAPAIDRLEIISSYILTKGEPHPPSRHVPTRRLAGWLLRLTSHHNLVGSLQLTVPYLFCTDNEDDNEAVLPLYDRATSLAIYLCLHKLRIQVGGAFAALNTLTISKARMDIRELEHMISSRCPSLKKLVLKNICTMNGTAPSLSVRSSSLEQLEIWIVKPGRADIQAPNLQTLRCFIPGQARIAAPMLTKLYWNAHCCDPSQQYIVEARRHLRRLSIWQRTSCRGLTLSTS
ncbi:hypothetical protein QOZ80_5BG0454240 [Eleusine coracana subsp. coracana]|nr:hypothetical protein QOZ80_5BG0454240 [Eleusine coracana subsp. coracana]